MTLRGVGAIFFGGCFLIVNALMLFLTGVWLRFSVYEQQVLSAGGNFTLPGGRASEPFDTIDTLFYQSTPFGVALLVIVSSVCLFVHVRLLK
jgi:hypothetical protein